MDFHTEPRSKNFLQHYLTKKKKKEQSGYFSCTLQCVLLSQGNGRFMKLALSCVTTTVTIWKIEDFEELNESNCPIFFFKKHIISHFFIFPNVFSIINQFYSNIKLYTYVSYKVLWISLILSPLSFFKWAFSVK